MTDAVWVEKELQFPNKHLLHMRPSQKIVEEALKYKSEMRFVVEGEEWNPKSMLEILIFAAEIVKAESDAFVFKARGEDAAESIEKISEFLSTQLFQEAA